MRFLLLLSLLAVVSCQSNETLNVTKLRPEEGAEVKQWVRASKGNLAGQPYILYMRDSESVWAAQAKSCKQTSLNELPHCGFQEHDKTLYETIGPRTHHVSLDNFAESISQCTNGKMTEKFDEDGDREELLSISHLTNVNLEIFWSKEKCFIDEESRNLGFDGCTSLQLKPSQ